jgi:hypothetical protein
MPKQKSLSLCSWLVQGLSTTWLIDSTWIDFHEFLTMAQKVRNKLTSLLSSGISDKENELKHHLQVSIS